MWFFFFWGCSADGEADRLRLLAGGAGGELAGRVADESEPLGADSESESLESELSDESLESLESLESAADSLSEELESDESLSDESLSDELDADEDATEAAFLALTALGAGLASASDSELLLSESLSLESESLSLSLSLSRDALDESSALD